MRLWNRLLQISTRFDFWLCRAHSTDWLHALSISSCGLRLDNEAIRVAVGLRLGLELCQPHSCPCGAVVDARGLHGLSCKKNAGRSLRHFQINDLTFRTLKRPDIASTKEPKGLVREDGKKPDGLTLVPWKAGKATWDATIVDTFSASYLKVSPVSPGQAAEVAADRKKIKYSTVSTNHRFIPIAVETMGSINQEVSG